MKRVSIKGVMVLVMLGWSVTGWGQAFNGQINGHVVDPQGSNVPGAQVTIVDVERGTTYKTTSNSTGLFVFPAVMPATYNLAVTARGFKRYEKDTLVLHASDHLSAGTIRLALGSLTQAVTVTAAPTPVQSTSSDRSAVLDSNQIADLMTEGRNVMQLTQTMPGVVLDGHGSPQLGTEQTGFVNGVRNDYNNVTIDGVTGSVTHQTQLDAPVDIDSVAEVKVLESGYEAQYGKTAGAHIQIVTKSGTSQFHGSGFYYVQNTSLNANTFLNNAHGGAPIPRPNWRYNVIGGNIGGPIYWPGLFNSHKDKLFFFFTGEYDPNTTPEPSSGLYHWNMPSYTLDSAGDVTFPASAFNTTPPKIVDPLTGKPFAGVPANTVPASRINPNMLKLLAIFPKPNAPAGSIPGCGACNYFLTGSDSTPRNVEQLRVDYNLSTNWHIFWMGKLTHEHESGLSTPAGIPQWLGSQVPIDYSTPTPGTSLGVTTIISPTVVNELTLGTEYWYEQQLFPNPSTLSLLELNHYGISIPSINPSENPLGVIPDLSFGGADTSNNPGYHFDGRFPMRDSAWAESLNDDLTKIVGAHSLKFGVNWERDEYVQLHNREHFAGSFSFDPNSNYPNTGYAYSDMLLGLYNNYQQPLQRPDYKPVTKVFEWYAQDEWHATHRLTLDYGVRFSKIFPQTLTQGANWNQAFYNPAIAPLLYQPTDCTYTIG
ncbi:MAG: carboxypeptidase regulatory-like domain-containing protein, partial [Terriglobia bacterium]